MPPTCCFLPAAARKPNKANEDWNRSRGMTMELMSPPRGDSDATLWDDNGVPDRAHAPVRWVPSYVLDCMTLQAPARQMSFCIVRHQAFFGLSYETNSRILLILFATADV